MQGGHKPVPMPSTSSHAAAACTVRLLSLGSAETRNCSGVQPRAQETWQQLGPNRRATRRSLSEHLQTLGADTHITRNPGLKQHTQCLTPLDLRAHAEELCKHTDKLLQLQGFALAASNPIEPCFVDDALKLNVVGAAFRLALFL